MCEVMQTELQLCKIDFCLFSITCDAALGVIHIATALFSLFAKLRKVILKTNQLQLNNTAITNHNE